MKLDAANRETCDTPFSSIFERYYSSETFRDRYRSEPENAVDVIIPVIHTNELWRANLLSIYREVPVNRLLISDGGCIDNSINVAKEFPRVIVLDHHQYTSLGYCLRLLIEEVETEWFLYLHSDVYLPDNWFCAMKKHQENYDWFGCPQQITVMVEYKNVDKLGDEPRPYAGSQMGKRSAFVEGLKKIDDDYVYRQEDLVLKELVEKSGFRHGWVEDTYHYHQVMHKDSPWARNLKRVQVEVEWSEVERKRQAETQLKGLVKYLYPSPNLVAEAEAVISILLDIGGTDWTEISKWIKKTNPVWLEHIKYWRIQMKRLVRSKIARLYRSIRSCK
ncbi:glycosyltransferase family 2 protein [Anaeroselena agilis]|uniref:Glycosyltransferase family A protein n=1 Tax=Anaeroselena agilis TaxID=3063788 RepID=A0ABU3P490_9FIRM|nr:glycosyltransferase family A protein [Selenomonadales bacterium 4137-cl]